MSPGISIVICCHNSAKRLPETLRHLAAQQTSPSLQWEIIVVNNASTDDTAAVAVANWPAQAPAPLRVIDELQAGLGYARVRAIREARFEVISFLDDDNWAAADWLARVELIFALHPEVGVCGGRSEAVTEIEPPGWFEQIKRAYAVGRQFDEEGDVTDAHGRLMWGAGLSVRTAAVRQLLDDGFVFRLSGRQGARLLAGEDTEICFALWASGWHFWYDDALVLSHYISAERLRWDYVLRLCSGMGNSSALIDLYLFALNRPPFENYPAWKKTWIFQFMKSLQKLSGTFLSHPLQCLFQPEGSFAALKFRMLNSMVMTLWPMRKFYRDIQSQLAKSRWCDRQRKVAT
jgi:glycosyltransferase involved in cell wall biosynthesis